MIKILPLRPSDIPFLTQEDALYVCDFRAISESMEYEIPAMWKYENLLPHIVANGEVAVNESWKGKDEGFRSIKVETDSDPRISVFKRLMNSNAKSKKKLWVAVPHPDADVYAKDHGIELNYSYEDFLKRNDKFSQKEYFAHLTPEWRKLEANENLSILEESGSGYIKRRYGSGGFTVFPLSKAMNSENFKNLYKENPQDWFVENRVDGKSFSIQCVKFKDSDEITIFGYSEQMIVEESIFYGSKIMKLDRMVEVRDELMVLLAFLQPMLDGYEGFFGIDFIVTEKGQVRALEVNTRLTAATIPTLMFNALNWESATYQEDMPAQEKLDSDFVLTSDAAGESFDILRKDA